MSSDRFYAELPEILKFSQVLDPARSRPLPDDWTVLIADVVDSTRAIERGRYKQVNAVGAAAITAVLNAVKPAAVPYVFGGDGATLAVPAGVLPAARSALAATRHMARAAFDLELRLGAVPAAEVRAAGAAVNVGRFRLSEHHAQAIFTGGGLAHAEAWVKAPRGGASYRIDPSEASGEADFSGFECRWRPVPSPRGETVCLLVQAVGADERDRRHTYAQVFEQVEVVYGSPSECRPVRTDALGLAASPRSLAAETGVRAAGRGAWGRVLYLAKLYAQQALGAAFFAWGAKAGGVEWGRYKSDLVAHTDYRKFDDALREVIVGDAAQRGRLRDWLEARRRRGELVYGMHASPAALLTCLVFNRQGDHVHFVDGSDGGYAMAALELKQQLAPQAVSR